MESSKTFSLLQRNTSTIVTEIPPCRIKGKVPLDSLRVRAAWSLEKGCVRLEKEEERAREQQGKGAEPGDPGLGGDRSSSERVLGEKERYWTVREAVKDINY